MQLYRYFHDLEDPFRGFTELGFETPEEYVQYMAENRAGCSRTYDLEYFRRRLFTEKKLYQSFIAAGGKPEKKYPYYFVLENCDEWFYDIKQCIGSICIDLGEIDESAVSFTYGDSVPALDEQFDRGQDYHGKVYTCGEIRKVIERHGWPQKWNPRGERGYATYIEVQVWTDEPVLRYRPVRVEKENYCEAGKNLSSREPGNEGLHPENGRARQTARLKELCGLLSRGALKASRKVDLDPETMPDIFEAAHQLKNDSRWQIFQSKLARLDPELFMKDPIHGLPHGLRCGFYMTALGIRLDLPEDILETMILAGLYHDIGRVSHGTDASHGAKSALRFPDLFPGLKARQMAWLQAAVHAHCLPEEEAENVICKYMEKYSDSNICGNDGEEETEICAMIAGLLRDADTLDFIRFGLRIYNTRFLKTDAAKELVLCAVEANLLFLKYPEVLKTLIS